MTIGNPIPASAFWANVLEEQAQTTLLKKHVYRVGKNKRGIFLTEKSIIHPVQRKYIKRELLNSELLGETSDGKKIYLCEYHNAPNTLNEIARLREITFRKVGEGTGKKMDLDRFDKIYKHIVVWDENDLEIVGSYRLGLGRDILKNHGVKGFYTSTLFNFSDDFIEQYFDSCLELGRSFIQKKYWKTNALHYLWQGIGAFLYHNSHIKYMFGPVSISKNYNQLALESIVYFYKKWYGVNSNQVSAFKELRLPEKSINYLNDEFTGRNPREDYFTLKSLLKPLGFTVPTLYKQYTELCEPDGVRFYSFGIDDSFEMCVDGFIQIEIGKIKAEKRERYINIHAQQNAVA